MNNQKASSESGEDTFFSLFGELDELSKLIIQNLALYPTGIKSRNELREIMKERYGEKVVHKNKLPFYRKIKWLVEKGIIVYIEPEKKDSEKERVPPQKKKGGGGKGKPIRLNPAKIEYTIYGKMRELIKSYVELFENYIETYSSLWDYEEVVKAKEIIFSELDQIENWLIKDNYPPSFKNFLTSSLSVDKNAPINLPKEFKKAFIYEILKVKNEIEIITVEKFYDSYIKIFPEELLYSHSPLDYIERQQRRILGEFLDIFLNEIDYHLDNTKENITYYDEHTTTHPLTEEEIKNKIKENLKKPINLPKKDEPCITPEDFANILIEALEHYVKSDFQELKKVYDKLNSLKENFKIFKMINVESPIFY